MKKIYNKLKTKLADRQLSLMKIIYYKLKTGIIKGKMKRAGKFIIYGPSRINGHKFIEIGNNVFIFGNCWLAAYNKIENDPILRIDDGCHLGDGTRIHAVKKIILEKNVGTAYNVYITDASHEYEDISKTIWNRTKFIGAVTIGENTLIGSNVCVFGAKIGRHCVIGANSIVSKDIPDYSIAVGSPARIIKSYNFKTKKWERVNNKEKSKVE